MTNINWQDAENEKPKEEEKELLIWFAGVNYGFAKYHRGEFYDNQGYKYQTVTHFAEINEPK